MVITIFTIIRMQENQEYAHTNSALGKPWSIRSDDNCWFEKTLAILECDLVIVFGGLFTFSSWACYYII